MRVELYKEPHSLDLFIVDAARVSFSKSYGQYTLKQNTGLINFLLKHNHFSPIAHPTFGIKIEKFPMGDLLDIMVQQDDLCAGLVFDYHSIDKDNNIEDLYITGSVFSMLTLCYEHLFCKSLDLILEDKCPIARIAYRKIIEDSGRTIISFDCDLICTLDERPVNYKPLKQVFATFKIDTPIFVARQLGKHQKRLIWNEESRRYIDFPPVIHKPRHWRRKADNAKQGSCQDKFITDIVDYLDESERCDINDDYEFITHQSLAFYKAMLKSNVCAEQARMVLPQSMETSWFWTGSLDAWARVCNLRCKSDTQKETREVAESIDALLKQQFGKIWRR